VKKAQNKGMTCGQVGISGAFGTWGDLGTPQRGSPCWDRNPSKKVPLLDVSLNSGGWNGGFAAVKCTPTLDITRLVTLSLHLAAKI